MNAIKHNMSLISHAPHSQLTYRPDIDGLRALAIIFVLAFHAFPSGLRGGYIGVDIFFVISGYLISSIILTDMQSGSFSIRNFYERRIRRIFPGLIVVLLATLTFGWLALLPNEFNQLSKHASLTTLFVANIGFWKEAGYFDNEAELKPLLHFWSLGVEEQFYIVWPLLLLVFSRRSSRIFAGALTAFTLLSFISNIAIISHHREAAFFLPFSRCWELSAGGLLAWHHVTRTRGADVYANIQAGTGALLILLAGFIYRDNFAFPGWWAIAPVAGAVLLISAGPAAFINRKILAHPTIVGIGLISYPLYLWHWPLLSFLHILGVYSPLTAGCAVILAFLLAWLTYRFIETPFRHKPAPRVSKPLMAGAIACLAIGLAGWSGNLQPHLNFPELKKYIAAKNDWDFPPPSKKIKVEDMNIYRAKGSVTDEVLFIGDSNMQQFSPRIEELMQNAQKKTLSAAWLTYGGCRPVPNTMKGQEAECLKIFPAAEKYIQTYPVRRIVLGGRWTSFFSEKGFSYRFPDGSVMPTNTAKARTAALNDLASFVRTAQKKSIEVYLVHCIPSDTPDMDGPVINRVDLMLGKVSGADYNVPETHPKSTSLHPDTRRILDVFAAQNGITVIDPVSTLCSGENCLLRTQDDILVYKDAAHLSASYVRSYATFMDQVILLNP